MNWIIPPEQWEKNRDRIVRRMVKKCHLTETNPGPDSSRLRFDYVLTRAELAAHIEEIMRETERLCVWHLEAPVRANEKRKGS